MELELRHLRMVVAVAQHGSVTKAAAAMGLSQPALTAQLNRIDRVLGNAVFTRDHTGAHPTPLGDLVLRHARVVLPAMAVLVDDAHRLVERSAGDARPLRVGTASTVLGGLFATHLNVAFPGVQVVPAVSWSVEETGARLADGALDVALVGVCGDASPPADRRVRWARVGTDPVLVLVDDGHGLADRGSVPLAELARELWLGAPGDGCFDRCFHSACARAGFTPRGLGETDRTAALDQVRAGNAVALAQPLLLDAPGVRAVALEGTPLRWAHHVGWRAETAERLDVDALVGAARRAHEDAVQRSPDYRRWLAAQGDPA